MNAIFERLRQRNNPRKNNRLRTITTKKITRHLPEYKEVKRLYLSAFPEAERFPLSALRFLALRKDVDFLSYYEDDNFCGFTFSFAYKEILFVLYFAVNDKIRSKGYGSEILAKLGQEAMGKTIVLNVEKPDDYAENAEQRQRRLKFYMKNGYSDTGYIMKEKDGDYLILSTSREFNPNELSEALKHLSFGLYNVKIEKA